LQHLVQPQQHCPTLAHVLAHAEEPMKNLAWLLSQEQAMCAGCPLPRPLAGVAQAAPTVLSTAFLETRSEGA